MNSITTKSLSWLIVSTLLLLCCLLFYNHSVADSHLRTVVERQALMALQFDLSIRKYAANNIRPLMYDLVGEDEFIPAAMSTSYIARSIFEDVRQVFPDYILKFSSDNPRNPANQAGPEELKIIEYLNQNPHLEDWEGIISIDGKRYMGKFSARRMKKSCLRCHGDPGDAPASLIEQYGDKAGFHRPLGEIIGMDTVAIPLAKVTERLWSESLGTLIILGGLLALFFFSSAVGLRILIIRRVKRIAGHFQRASRQEDYSRIELIQTKGRDEISQLANGFNSLTDKLRQYYASLESKVALRTQALEEKNAQLEQAIESHRYTEKTLEEREATIRSIFQAAPTGIGMVVNRIIQQVNPRLCQMLGYTADELLGQSAVVFYPSTEEYEWVGTEKYAQIKTRGTGTVETHWVTKDGAQLNILLSSTPLDPEDWSAGITFVALDYTDLYRAKEKEKQLEERLARSHKMEALGLLAGGVAHDLNNVLSGIVSYPDLILMDLSERSPIRKSIETIRSSGKKAAAIVEDLLTMARRGVTHTEILNLNHLVKDCLDSPEWKKNLLHHDRIQVIPVLEDSLLNIQGSSIHLKKTVMNLLTNAAEALPREGTIHISTQNQYVDQAIEGYDHVAEGDFAVLTVSDNGIGIDPNDLRRIFEPFYTKKVMGRSGTGLGMSVVWGTVQDHSGYIHVESTPHQGTLFQLYFPVTREALQKTQGPIPVDAYAGDGRSILVVDDVETQRNIASEILTWLGYKVTVASSGEEAVEKVQTKAYDLMMLDMIMDPGIDGLETYRKVLEIHPGQKAIIASGFSESNRVKKAHRLGAGTYIKKPYTLEKLGLAVRDELGRLS
jgi:two-component system, cell cycle sensor histidine kinase and response regulator CckA